MSVSSRPAVQELAPPGAAFDDGLRRAVRELWTYRDLLQQITLRDVRIRYKQAVMGFAWAILMPALIVAAGTLVRAAMAHVGNRELDLREVAGVAVKALPWAFFVGTLGFATNSLTGNMNLVTKVYFPRALLPLAAVIVPMVDYVVGLPVLIALMWVYDTWPGGLEVFAAPLFMGLALLTALGAGFFLSALNVRYRDVRYVIPVFLSVLPLLSGVMYAVHSIPEKWQWVLSLNPMTAVISGVRWSVLDAAAPNWWQIAVGVAVAAGVFVVGLAVFRASEPKFADTI